MKNFTDYQTKVAQVIQDADTELETTDRDAFIEEAIGIHSKHRPQEKVLQVTGPGDYLYDLPEDWEEGFSVIESVEYPAGEQPPVFLDPTQYMLYQGASNKQIRFLYDSPETSETFLVTYTLRHSVDNNTGTIPDACKE